MRSDDKKEGKKVIYLRLFFEFCKIGLFSIGGGLATIPFLAELGERTGWFASGELANMIAISETTPGPMGVNMATYVGFTSGGLFGGVVATLGLVFPSIVIILIISKFLQKFRQSQVVDSIFYGLRAASVALISMSLLKVAQIALLRQSESSSFLSLISWPAVALFILVFLFLRVSPLKKLHPICFIAFGAVVGIMIRL